MTGRPSTPRLLDSITGVSGILDHPLSRMMTTEIQFSNSLTPSLRANGSRECAPDDRLREAIHGAANAASEGWIASSHPPSPEGGLRRTGGLLAMTARHNFAISPNGFFARYC